jgi:hypothetical protein
LDGLVEAGFEGFKPIAALQAARCRAAPPVPGVYLILRPDAAAPRYVTPGSGGRFKGRDWAYPVATLADAWVEGALVLYVGKAGGPGQRATLRGRLDEYMQFGLGRPVAHTGGRSIWQLDGSDRLLACWRPTPGQIPEAIEIGLIEAFKAAHGGRRPFANRRG